MDRARAAWKRVSRSAASAAGVAMRLVALSGPSLGGAALVSYGLGQIYRPLMFIAAGGFLLLADRKLTTTERGER